MEIVMKILKTVASKPAKYPVMLPLSALSGSAIMWLLFNIWHTLRYSGTMDGISRVLLALHIPFWGWLGTAALLLPVLYLCGRYGSSVGEFLYRYRFLLAAALWIFCILFKISGASVACWGDFLGTDLDARGLLLGTSRVIRSDEWATYTPMMLSQQYGQNGAYPYFSEILRGTSTDTFIVYGLPVRDPAVLFRPFHWGFLFLGAERGFSFYWCGRIIALALVSFELGMLVTQSRKFYAFLISLLFTLAPTVQWWIGVNGLVEMLVFGQLAVLLLHHYMHTESFLLRFCIGLLLVICAGGYILVFYPAWQVPIAYVVLSLLIWVILDSWKDFRFSPGKDLPILAGCAALLCTGMAYIFLKSSDTVSAVLNTAYPGQRIDCGGGDFFEMLRYGGNFFFPLFSVDLPGGPCELSVFISFAPMGFLLALFVLLKEKKADSLLAVLLGFDLFLNTYMMFSYPEILAKLTLLSKSTPGRVTQVIGILDILLLFRSLTLLKTRLSRRSAAGLSILFAAFVSLFNRRAYGAYLPPLFLAGLMIILFFGCFLLLGSSRKPEKRIAALFFPLLMFLSGGLVNPVQQGLDVIYNTDLMKEVQTITARDPDGLWICDNLGYPLNDYFIMGGAPTIDSVHTYPTMEHWRALDPEGNYTEVYNRFAHVMTSLQKEETVFLMTEDQMLDTIILCLDIDDLRTLHVSYVATNRRLEDLNTETISFEQIGNAQEVRIYKVVYQKNS